jgi:hypothetical protein
LTKNLILQISIPGVIKEDRSKWNLFAYIPEMYDMSTDYAAKYASRIGADHYVMRTKEYSEEENAACQRFAVFTDMFKEYDNIVYWDSDYFIGYDYAPNIFDVMNSSTHEFFASLEPTQTPGYYENLRKKHFQNMDVLFFNNGFMGFKRESIEKMKPKLNEALTLFGGSYKDLFGFNWLAQRTYDDKYGVLTRNWNGVTALKLPLFSIHFCGRAKKNFTVQKVNDLFDEKKSRVSTLPSNTDVHFEHTTMKQLLNTNLGNFLDE